MNLTNLEFPLADNLTAVGDDVSPLPASNALLQLAELVQGLLAGLTAGPISRSEIKYLVLDIFTLLILSGNNVVVSTMVNHLN